MLIMYGLQKSLLCLSAAAICVPEFFKRSQEVTFAYRHSVTKISKTHSDTSIGKDHIAQNRYTTMERAR
jgi:hypothetical protein